MAARGVTRNLAVWLRILDAALRRRSGSRSSSAIVERASTARSSAVNILKRARSSTTLVIVLMISAWAWSHCASCITDMRNWSAICGNGSEESKNAQRMSLGVG